MKSRETYTREVRALLCRALDEHLVERILADQYPQRALLARAELRFRGLDCPELPRGAYSAAAVDGMAVALEAAGRVLEQIPPGIEEDLLLNIEELGVLLHLDQARGDFLGTICDHPRPGVPRRVRSIIL